MEHYLFLFIHLAQAQGPYKTINYRTNNKRRTKESDSMPKNTTDTTCIVRGARSVKRSSVCPSACLSHPSTAAAACGQWWICCWVPCGQEIWNIDRQQRVLSSTVQSSIAFSSKCEQWHIYSCRRRLNADLLTVEMCSCRVTKSNTLQCVWSYQKQTDLNQMKSDCTPSLGQLNQHSRQPAINTVHDQQ